MSDERSLVLKGVVKLTETIIWPLGHLVDCTANILLAGTLRRGWSSWGGMLPICMRCSQACISASYTGVLMLQDTSPIAFRAAYTCMQARRALKI